MFLRRFAACALFLALASSFCLAQPSPAEKVQADRDMAELQAFTLTMDAVTRATEAIYDIGQAGKADPSIVAALKNDDSDRDKSLDQMGNSLGKSPKVVAILAAHGLTARKLAVIQVSLVQAGVAVAAIKAGAKVEDLVTQAHVNPANIKFVQDHQTDLEELQKKYPPATAD